MKIPMSIPLLATLLATLLAVALPGCDKPSAEASEAWADIPAGDKVKRVVFDSAQIASPVEIPLHEDLRINGAASDALLGTINEMTVDGAGNIYVLQRRLSEVTAFDSTGRLLHRFGRKGRGPGEFNDASAISTIGDTIFVAAPGYIHAFARDGVSLWSVRNVVPDSVSTQRVTDAVAIPSAMVSIYVENRNLQPMDPPTQDLFILNFVDPRTGTVNRAQITFDSEPRHYLNVAMSPAALLGPRLRVAIAGDGLIYVTRGAGYTIDVHSADGDFAERWSAPFDRPGNTENDFKAYRAYLLALPPAIPEWTQADLNRDLFELVPRSARRPVLGDLIVDADRTIIAKRISSLQFPYDGPPHRQQWDLIVHGAYEGQFQLPETVTPMVLRYPYLYCIEADEDDVPSIIRYRLQ
jgi:hypothetical protein